jgi:hypothetical protein
MEGYEMIGRLGVAAILTAAVLPFTAGAADAQTRLRLGYYPYEPSYDSYYAGPLYIPQPRYYYYERLQPRRWPGWRRPNARNLYGYNPNKQFYVQRPPYFEGDLAPPPRKKKKKKLSIPDKKSVSTNTTKKKVAAREVDIPDANGSEAAPVKAPAKKQASGISCDKAGDIVAGYGFSGVKATSCQGSTYSFAAAREGKPYTIKLSAASGELTEVKKVK